MLTVVVTMACTKTSAAEVTGSRVVADSVSLITAAEGENTTEFRIKKRFLPTSRRIDREINKNKFVYRGETMLGLTASYGTITSEDADMFPIF